MSRCFFRGWLLLFVIGLQPAHADFLGSDHLDPNRFEGTSNVSKQQFDKILQDIFRLYDRRIWLEGGDLIVNRLWENDLVSATATRRANNWIINIYGGLARREEVTPDGLALVACHEIGHHLAGFPYWSRYLSAEGNADFFAVHSCLHELWQDRQQENAMAASQVSPPARSICDREYEAESEQHLCYRKLMAARSTSLLLGDLDGSESNFETPDPTVVDKTWLVHPKSQCRLDTFVAAALCQRTHEFVRIPWNEVRLAEVSCHQTNSTLGLRPRCWFAPRYTGLHFD